MSRNSRQRSSTKDFSSLGCELIWVHQASNESTRHSRPFLCSVRSEDPPAFLAAGAYKPCAISISYLVLDYTPPTVEWKGTLKRAYRRSARYVLPRLSQLECLYDLTHDARVADVYFAMSLRHMTTCLRPNSGRVIAQGNLTTLHVDWIAHAPNGPEALDDYHLSDFRPCLEALCTRLISLGTLPSKSARARYVNPARTHM